MDALETWYKTVRVFMQFSAMYPFKKSKNSTFYLLRFFYKIFIWISFIFVIISAICSFAVKNRLSLIEEFYRLLNLGILFGAFLSILYIHWNFVELDYLIKQNLKNFKKLGQGNNFHQRSQKDLSRMKYFLINFNILQLVCGVSIILIPLFNNRRELPIDMWLPFHLEKTNKCFRILFIIQLILQFITSLVWATVISYLALLVTCFSFQIDQIAFEFKNCMSEVWKKLKSLKCEDSDPRSQEFQFLFQQVFSKKTEKLHKLLQLRKRSGFIQSFFAFVVFMATFAIIFSIIYSILAQSDTEKWFSIPYTIVIFLFLMGIFVIGEIISRKSKEIPNAIYSMPWYYCSAKSQKLILITLICTQDGLNIRIGKWAILNFETLLKVFKLVYSCITLTFQVIS